jgi:signal transduction histidine kinase
MKLGGRGSIIIKVSDTVSSGAFLQIPGLNKIALRAFSLEVELNAIERERLRVARELHDEVLPLLARLTRFLQAQPEIAGDPECNALRAMVHRTIARLRDLLGELHPVDLEELGLVPALSNICSRYARLTELCILSVERVEEFALGRFEQLCLYRAMQAVLRMFANSDNDILVVTSDCLLDTNFISVRCVDKRVSSAEWISAGQPEFSEFEACCDLSGADVEIQSLEYGEFPCDLIISIPSWRRRKRAGDSLIENCKPADLQLQRDVAFFEKLAASAERQKISRELERSVSPCFKEMKKTAMTLTYTNPYVIDFLMRLHGVEASFNAVISGLHPDELTESGLLPSIRTLLNRFQMESGIAAGLETELTSAYEDLSSYAKFTIYRSIQEALNNVERHSGATRVRVSLKQSGSSFVIHVEDNGRGLGSGRGFLTRTGCQSRGLKYITERAAAIGAAVSWENSVYFASGTRLTISLG